MDRPGVAPGASAVREQRSTAELSAPLGLSLAFLKIFTLYIVLF